MSDDLTPTELLNICHQNAHSAENDPEDALLISITRREVWLTMLAYMVLGLSQECLEKDCAVFVRRLAELMDTQKPHWRDPDAPSS